MLRRALGLGATVGLFFFVAGILDWLRVALGILEQQRSGVFYAVCSGLGILLFVVAVGGLVALGIREQVGELPDDLADDGYFDRRRALKHAIQFLSPGTPDEAVAQAKTLERYLRDPPDGSPALSKTA